METISWKTFEKNIKKNHFKSTIEDIKWKLLKIEELDEEIINNKYIELDNSKISLLCSYTTKMTGFLDIILRWNIISSKEIDNNIWDLFSVDNHRWWYMWNNTTISFSSWFVSYKYFDKNIKNRDSFDWWIWLFSSLENLIKKDNLDFSHCSSKWWIKNYDLNKDNIVDAVHTARKEWELYDDWYWNIFEILIEKNDIEFPKVDIKETIIAIPYDMKNEFEKLLKERQSFYKSLLNKAETKKEEDFINSYLWIIDTDTLPIYRYKEKNIEIAMKRLSIK